MTGLEEQPWSSEVTGALCISLLYTESRPRSEHIDGKTATFGTFLIILSYKNALKCQADNKAPFCVKHSSNIFKKGPIVAVLPCKCSDLEGDFPSINEMHSGFAKTFNLE